MSTVFCFVQVGTRPSMLPESGVPLWPNKSLKIHDVLFVLFQSEHFNVHNQHRSDISWTLTKLIFQIVNTRHQYLPDSDRLNKDAYPFQMPKGRQLASWLRHAQLLVCA